MRHPFLIASLACALSSTTMADTIGFEVGAYGWQQNFSGSVASDSIDVIDIEKDLGYDDETSNVFYALVEHPLPLIPNVRIQKTDLNLSATGSTDLNFGGITYTGAVRSSIDLTARYIADGSVEITDIQAGSPTFGEKASFDADGVLPLLYVSARFELPLTGLYVGANINGLGVNDDSVIDYRINVGYETAIGFGVEAGFRSFELDYDDDDDKADLTIDGAYAGIFYHF
jgi:outer membrane protein